MWINAQGQIYDGDCQPGDQLATSAQIQAYLYKQALSALADAYLSDIQTLNLNWLSASVSDGTTEAVKQTAITQAISARKTQYLNDLAALKTQYSN